MRVKSNAQERQKQQQKTQSMDVGFSKESHLFFVVAFKGVVIGFGGGDLLDGDDSFS